MQASCSHACGSLIRVAGSNVLDRYILHPLYTKNLGYHTYDSLTNQVHLIQIIGSLNAKNLLNNKKSQNQPPPPELPQYEKAEGS